MYPIRIPINEMNAFDLPKRCLITGETEGVEFRKMKLGWYPPWIAIFIIGALLIALILMLILTKRANGELPFTPKAYRRWKIGQGMFIFSVVLAIVPFIMGIVVAITGDGSKPVAVGIASFLAAIALPTGIWFWLVRGKSIRVKRIDNTHLTLMVPKHEVAEAFQRHLTGGARAVPALAVAPIA